MLGGDAALCRITLTARYYCRRHSILLGIAVYTEGSPVTVYQCDTVTTHGLDRQHHDVDRTPRGRVSQNEDRDKWRKYVCCVANPRIARTAKEQSRTIAAASSGCVFFSALAGEGSCDWWKQEGLAPGTINVCDQHVPRGSAAADDDGRTDGELASSRR